ncbi:MAG: HPr family phosphocarrier protein [Lentisphaeria bacterium]|nr:HPr family phosphocarrier protein [Lentisphaeria bacterium]
MIQLSKTFIVPNELGLHARAATRFTQLVSGYTSDVVVDSNSLSANAKSVLELMTLGVAQGGELTIHVSGIDADTVMAAIENLFANNLGE